MTFTLSIQYLLSYCTALDPWCLDFPFPLFSSHHSTLLLKETLRETGTIRKMNTSGLTESINYNFLNNPCVDLTQESMNTLFRCNFHNTSHNNHVFGGMAERSWSFVGLLLGLELVKVPLRLDIPLSNHL